MITTDVDSGNRKFKADDSGKLRHDISISNVNSGDMVIHIEFSSASSEAKITTERFADNFDTINEQNSKFLMEQMLTGHPLLRSSMQDDLAIKAAYRKTAVSESEIERGFMEVARGNSKLTD